MVDNVKRIKLLYTQRHDLDAQMERLHAIPDSPEYKQILLALMSKSNEVDIEIMRLEHLEKMTEINKHVDWESENNKYAEGHRKFLVAQFEALTEKRNKELHQ